MKVIPSDSSELRLQASAKEHLSNSVMFDFALVPLDYSPKRLVIEQRTSRHFNEYKLSWRKFMRQKTVGDIVIIRMEEFAHYEDGKRVSGKMT